MKKLAAILIPLVAAPAFAEEIDFSQPVLGLDGKPAFQCAAKTPECEKPLLLGDLSAVALSRSPAAEPSRMGSPLSVPADDKVRRGKLALKLYGAGKLDLAVEDISLVKASIGAVIDNSVLVARAWAMLDPVSKKP